MSSARVWAKDKDCAKCGHRKQVVPSPLGSGQPRHRCIPHVTIDECHCLSDNIYYCHIYSDYLI